MGFPLPLPVGCRECGKRKREVASARCRGAMAWAMPKAELGSNADGAGLALTSGAGDGTGEGGSFGFVAGTGGDTGAGGEAFLVCGEPGATSGSGGRITLLSGSGKGADQTSGTIRLTIGAATDGATSGNLMFINLPTVDPVHLLSPTTIAHIRKKKV